MTATTDERSSFFRASIETHKGILYKIARAYCENEIDRQDLIQEMMIQIWRALPGYNNTAAFSTWIYRICLNVAISYHRKEKKQQQQLIDAGSFLIQHQSADDEEKENNLKLLEQFITELKEIDRAVMLLYLEDRPQAEIADILGLSTTNISTMIYRIKEKLRKRFSQLNTD